VVFVSASNRRDEPIINARKLADWLAGVAHVYVGVDRFPSFTMKNFVHERLNCWDGAVRVYWPGFSLSDEPYRHRIWTPTEIRTIERQYHPHGFIEFLLGWISDVAVFSTDPGAPSWSGLEVLRRRRLVEEARLAGNQDELLEIATEEIDDKNTLIDDLQGQIQDLANQLGEALAQRDSFKQAYLGVCELSAQKPTATQPNSVPIDSVADAVERAEQEFGEHLIFALNSQSDGKNSPFEHPDEAFAAFEFLATTYFDARTGETPCDDFDLALREANGWRYLGRHNWPTMKKYSNWYSTKWNGRTIWLTEHLGTGSSKEPRRTIRLGFCWDDDSRKVVIGFLGQHQQTDAT